MHTNKMKNLILVTVFTCLFSLIAPLCIKSYAAVSGEVDIIVSQTHAYTQPSVDSDSFLDLDVGDSVFVTGQEGDFYIIYYKDLTGYVPKYAIDGTDAPASVTGVSVNPDAASLASSAKQLKEENNKAVHEEFKEQEEYNEQLEKTLEQQKKSKRNTIIWISVMGALCVGLVVISVIAVLKNKDNEQEDNDKKDNDKKDNDKKDNDKKENN